MLNVDVSQEEFERRRREWQPPEPRVKKGSLTLYAQLAEPATRGAGLKMKM